MIGLVIIILSFVVSAILRTILIKKEECSMAKFLPQIVMLVGSLIGAYLFLQDNWSNVVS